MCCAEFDVDATAMRQRLHVAVGTEVTGVSRGAAEKSAFDERGEQQVARLGVESPQAARLIARQREAGDLEIFSADAPQPFGGIRSAIRVRVHERSSHGSHRAERQREIDRRNGC
jgi:formate-dependent nitrite reductase cytochrome c552 subunit